MAIKAFRRAMPPRCIIMAWTEMPLASDLQGDGCIR